MTPKMTGAQIEDMAAAALKEEVSDKKQNDFEGESVQETEGNLKSEDIAEKIIYNANQYFLVKILSPQIEQNEQEKRKHKEKLISIVKIFLICQFFILMCLLFGIVTMTFVFHGTKNDLDLSYLELLTKFVSLYITSVVAELIAMLYFIVSNVFDTSITGLVELYKDATGNKNESIIKEQEKS